jgi:hypothetical protein
MGVVGKGGAGRELIVDSQGSQVGEAAQMPQHRIIHARAEVETQRLQPVECLQERQGLRLHGHTREAQAFELRQLSEGWKPRWRKLSMKLDAFQMRELRQRGIEQPRLHRTHRGAVA